MAITVDLSQARDKVDPGTYPAIVSGIEQKDGKKFPYLRIDYTISEGEDSGFRLFENYSLDPKAGYKIKEFLVATGQVDPEDKVTTISFEPDEVIGTGVVIVVDDETYEVEGDNGTDSRTKSAVVRVQAE